MCPCVHAHLQMHFMRSPSEFPQSLLAGVSQLTVKGSDNRPRLDFTLSACECVQGRQGQNSSELRKVGE